jgi:hypothetical protein
MRCHHHLEGFLLAAFTCASFACSTGAMDMSALPDPRPPVINKALNRTFGFNDGLLRNLGVKGTPIIDGETMDPAILESRRFYDTVTATRPIAGNVGLGAPTSTAPMSLEEWKRAFSFPPRQAGEELEAYRQRAGIAIYYNKNELGLGRELGCSEFDDGTDAAGNKLTGVACYVSNFGVAFRDVNNSLLLAQEGDHPKNTVCITYRPSMDEGYEIQFYVYGPEGGRLDWAQLDTLGPRANPHVCMNCHGGVYDEKRHLAKYARFLPLDPNVVVFAEGHDVPASFTRAGQEEKIRRLNALSLRTPLTPGQREMMDQLYGGTPETPGTVSRLTWQPRGWRDNPQHAEVFDQVLKPYCITCHLAMNQGLDGSPLGSYDIFSTPDKFRAFPSYASVCGQFGMPNAQTTLMNFWDTGWGPVTVGDKQYPAAADAFLAFFGRDRSHCGNLEELSTCNRGPDPDMNCGNAFSGTACMRDTGRCVPKRGLSALADPNGSVGVCKTNGTRGCPSPLECRPSPTPLLGLDSAGFDGVCTKPGTMPTMMGHSLH